MAIVKGLISLLKTRAAHPHPAAPEPSAPPPAANDEVQHWNRTERRTGAGERIFWLQQPRVNTHYYSKGLVDGMAWRQYIPHVLGRPAETALELGCGNGQCLTTLLSVPTARNLVGIDLDESRFAEARQTLGEAGRNIRFLAADINQLSLEESSYELIYSVQSFHHFENLEHIYAEIYRALRPGGFCVLEEYVGPARFQWTDTQLALIRHILGIMPLHLRMYANGMEKNQEGRSTVEEVIRFCPSEAVRSNEILPLFHRTFDTVIQRNLGGTIQQTLYSGIIHNFPDHDPATDHLIDSIAGLETAFIDSGVIPSDFAVLIGRKK
jgi:ubiquinone/menaquinone biosynthesis C-methylase UbiE